MPEVKYTTRFQRDYKRERFGRHAKKLDVLLMEAINLLAADLVLLYRKPDDNSLELVRLGSHSELGL